MRRTTPMRIGELWNEFVESRPALARRLAVTKVPDLWPQVVGPTVAAYTESVEVVNGVLYVRMRSAAARNEIFMRREELKDAINKALGIKAVNVVIVK